PPRPDPGERRPDPVATARTPSRPPPGPATRTSGHAPYAPPLHARPDRPAQDPTRTRAGTDERRAGARAGRAVGLPPSQWGWPIRRGPRPHRSGSRAVGRPARPNAAPPADQGCGGHAPGFAPG